MEQNANAPLTFRILTDDEAKNFVDSWCGSGALANLRVRDADEYLVSDDVPSWFKADLHGVTDYGDQQKFITNLKKIKYYNGMLPSGQTVLADFSSGSSCQNTLVAVDALAMAYLHRLSGSANAVTCTYEVREDHRKLNIVVPALAAHQQEDIGSSCDSRVGIVLSGGDDGTLTISQAYGGRNSSGLFDFILLSYTLEVDGSANFIRSDGSLKFFYSDFSRLH